MPNARLTTVLAGGSILIFAVIIGVVWKVSINVERHNADNRYQQLSRDAINEVHSDKFVAALSSAIVAGEYQRTSFMLSLERVLKLIEPRGLRLVPGSYSSLPLAVDGTKAIHGKYDIIGLASTVKGLLNVSPDIMDNTDLLAYTDRYPIGAVVYASVVTPENKMRVVKATVMPLLSGAFGYSGCYVNSRFGVSVNMPVLTTDGVDYGWIPSYPSQDGSGVLFTDPLDQSISVRIYGSNSAGMTLDSMLPTSATVIKRLNVSGYPAIMYSDLISVNGLPTIDEGIISGSSTLSSMNGVDIDVPKSMMDKWVPTINNMLNSFSTGDLKQAY